MGKVTLTGLERKFERIQALARRAALASEPVHFTTYWGGEEIPHEPGAIIIHTEWGSFRNIDDREDKGQDD